jgi:hypothetical protein
MPQLGAGLFERGVRDDGDVVLRGREGSRAQGARRRRAGRGSPPAARVRLRCWLNSDSQAGMGASSIGTLTHRTRGRARARSETEARAAGCFRGGRRAVFCRPSKPHPSGKLGRANWAPQTVSLTLGTEWLVIGRWAGQRCAPHAANEWNPDARSTAPIADTNPFDFVPSRTGQRTDCRSSLRSSTSLAKSSSRAASVAPVED